MIGRRRGEERGVEGCRRMMDVRDRITIRYLLGVHCCLGGAGKSEELERRTDREGTGIGVRKELLDQLLSWRVNE